jgi:L-fuconate dehydratase
MRITEVTARDIRFPTSRTLAGSDAVHTSPDYSAAYVTLSTDHADGLEGHGLSFTCGRGTELIVAGIQSLAPQVRGRSLDGIAGDFRGFWRSLTSDGQLRWVGPEKGVIHMATSAIVNAIWDLLAKSKGKPLWKLLADMSPEELVSVIDFRYITDVLTPDEALDILRKNHATRGEREAELIERGYPAYTTSAGWLGYSDEKLRALCREAVAAGWTHVKMKVGADLDDDLRRAAIVRE